MAGKNETTTDKLFLKRKKFRNCRNEVQDLTLKFDKIFQLHSYMTLATTLSIHLP